MVMVMVMVMMLMAAGAQMMGIGVVIAASMQMGGSDCGGSCNGGSKDTTGIVVADDVRHFAGVAGSGNVVL